MESLAEIAANSATYVRVQALKTIVRELSPHNPNRRHVMRELEGGPPPPKLEYVNGYLTRESQRALVLASMTDPSEYLAAEAQAQAEAEAGPGEETPEPEDESGKDEEDVPP